MSLSVQGFVKTLTVPDEEAQGALGPSLSLCFPKELRSRQFWRAMLAECIATLVLVSTVLGSTVPGSDGVPVGPIYPAVALGVVITAMVQCFGEISGAQVRRRSHLSR